MTANNTSKLTHVYNSLQCIYEARYENVGKPQAFAGMTISPVIPGQAQDEGFCQLQLKQNLKTDPHRKEKQTA